VHESYFGKEYLVTHGDLFDTFKECVKPRPIKSLGGWIYPNLVSAGNILSRLGWSPRGEHAHWCTHWKQQSRLARKHIRDFEEFMAFFAQAYKCDGVICGHIHLPASKKIHGLEYWNCGDWVEHSSMVVEWNDGSLELIESLNALVKNVESHTQVA